MATRERPRRVGLALSGGAVRGAAHIGVLEVLERVGVTPALVAGTSIGSLVGAAWAAGLSAARIGELFGGFRWPKLARVRLGNRFSLLDTGPLETVVRDWLGVTTFEELQRPFAAVACDLLTGRRVVFRSGPLAPALRASSAVPGIFPPLEADGAFLVDGCVVDNLPVDVAREMGADYVIGVDLIPAPHGARPRNFIEFMNLAGFLWSRANHPLASEVDCYICPAIAEYSGWSLAEVDELRRLGRAAAESALPGLLADLGLPPG